MSDASAPRNRFAAAVQLGSVAAHSNPLADRYGVVLMLATITWLTLSNWPGFVLALITLAVLLIGVKRTLDQVATRTWRDLADARAQKITDLESEHRELKREMHDMALRWEARLTATNESHQREIAAMQASIDQLRAENRTLNWLNVDLQKQVATLKGNLDVTALKQPEGPGRVS